MNCPTCGRPLAGALAGQEPLCPSCDGPPRQAVRPADDADERRRLLVKGPAAPADEPAVRPPLSVRVVRPVWVYLVAGTYLAGLLALLLLPVWVASVQSFNSPSSAALVLLVLILILFLLGLSLLVIPIGHVRRRPAGKASIVFTIVGSATCAAVLAFGGTIALYELADPPGNQGAHAVWVAPLLVWLAWVLLFSWLTTSLDPLSLADRAYKRLLGGSVLELLVAVLSHVVVRRRPHCCAGAATALGIILGTAILIVALGPGVFFLFYRRYQQVYSRPKPPYPEDADG